MSASLKLMAEDTADLEIIAAAAQDALVRAGDLAFDARARRFTLTMNRFRWEQVSEDGPYERIRAALSFEGVLNVKSRKLRREDPEAVAALLSVQFQPDEEPPGGKVKMTLAGGGEVLLDVECLDAILVDLGESWRTPRRPDHERA
jgi:hypothetical protein